MIALNPLIIAIKAIILHTFGVQVGKARVLVRILVGESGDVNEQNHFGEVCQCCVRPLRRYSW